MTRARELARLGNTNVLTVDSDNNLGIGSLTPDRRLDVGTGDLVVGAAITLGGSSGIISATKFSGGWSGSLSIDDSTTSTSETTGALIITGGVGIAKSLFVGEGISVGGTITYDDVTNIDSVGIVTAGKGFRATTGGLVVSAGNVKVTAGIVTVGAGLTLSSDFVHLGDNKKIQLGIASDLTIQHNATNSVINNTTGQMRLAGDDLRLMNKDEDETYATFANDGAATIYYDNTAKIETISAGASVYGGLRLQGGGLIRENVNISSTALNSDKVINLSQGMVHYRSSAVGAANVKLNVISTAGINTDMAIGDALTLTVITVAGSASHFVDQLRIDGVEATAGVTTHWVGGSAPTDGGASGVDTYAFNIIKTANAAYLAVANKVATS